MTLIDYALWAWRQLYDELGHGLQAGIQLPGMRRHPAQAGWQPPKVNKRRWGEGAQEVLGTDYPENRASAIFSSKSCQGIFSAKMCRVEIGSDLDEGRSP